MGSGKVIDSFSYSWININLQHIISQSFVIISKNSVFHQPQILYCQHSVLILKYTFIAPIKFKIANFHPNGLFIKLTSVKSVIISFLSSLRGFRVVYPVIKIKNHVSFVFGNFQVTRVGNRYVFSATVPKEDAANHLVTRMVDAVFDGSPDRLVMALLDGRGVTAEEAKRIRALIRKAERNEQ